MMRFFATPGTLIEGALIALEAPEAHHAEVRRGAEGEPVELLDGQGAIGVGTLERSGKHWNARLTAVRGYPEPAPLVLALGAGDRDRFLSVAQQCGELGLTRLVPVETERSRQVESRLRGAGVEKARRRAREACKQSGNPWLPVIDDVMPLTELGMTGSGVRWLFGDPTGSPLGALRAEEAVGWVIGPEGGFTPPEVGWLRERLDATGVWFGPHILRFETAAVAAAVLTLQQRERARLGVQ